MDSALKFNKISGVNQVVIGATLMSVATTLPEVFVSIFAVVSGNHGIAVGNAVGSMISNIALVLALYMVFMPHRVSRRALIGKVFYLFIATGMVFLFATNYSIGWFEGFLLLIVFVAFLLISLQGKESDKVVEVVVKKEKTSRKEVWSVVGGLLAGQVMLVVGAFLLVDHGERLAHLVGVSETVVGLTVIAIGTSVPELVTCIVSIRKKSGELALGNIIGSAIISCTLLIGICALVGDIYGPDLALSRDIFLISLPFLFVIYCVAIVPMMLKARTYRWQGIALLSLYVFYVGYLVVVN